MKDAGGIFNFYDYEKTFSFSFSDSGEYSLEHTHGKTIRIYLLPPRNTPPSANQTLHHSFIINLLFYQLIKVNFVSYFLCLINC